MKKERQFAFFHAKRMIAKTGRSCAFACFLFCSLVVHAAGQITQRVSLNLQNATMGEFIRQVKQQTGYTFFYNDKVLKALEPLTVREENVPLEEVLRNVLDGTRFTFVVEGKTIILKEAAPQVQERVVKGGVRDAQGNALPGASVIIKGTTIGTATDVDGKYTLSMPDGNHVLVFSMMGMQNREEPVGTRKEINVTLQEKVSEMDEVVVTGIFTRKKESFTGSSSTFTNKELKMIGNANVLESLKTLDPSFVNLASPK